MRITKLLRETLCSFLFALLVISASFSQNVGINDDGSMPDNSAALDVKSTSKGLLIPRMTEIQRIAITSPATGLMVYQLDGIPGFYYYDGASWTIIGSEGGFWNANGDHIFNTNTGRVGIGTDSAWAKLHVHSDTHGTELLLDGSATGSTDINIRTNTTASDIYRQFIVSGTESGDRPRLNFAFNDFNIDVSAFNPLMTLEAFNDPMLPVYGDVYLPYGKLHGQCARFIDTDGLYDDVVHILSSSAGYGLHVDLNAPFGSAAIAGHATEGATGVEGYSDGGNGGYFTASDGGNALVTGSGNVGVGKSNPQAKLDVNGDINLSGEVNRKNKTGNANLVPIAYGMIRSNASVASGTGNISCTWNNTYKRYEIAIGGESYFWLNYITTATPITGGNRISTSSVGGKLLVKIYNNSGSQVQGAFQFVTYKP